ncbi:uncharacterized protein LOC114761740 [Neltuma alba]|uniref:uncharacterized protein LOC114761740 n=1 Tax=Neltuma alba TaxID=207710 RepID=UPI0010A4D7D9|nr:uncharacterized protein LOC114761740 [Prosopis alba]
MHALRRIGGTGSILKRFSELVSKPHLNSPREFSARFWSSSSRGSKNGEDEWNEAWEAAWLPEDLTPKARAPWETDVNFPSEDSTTVLSADVDAETKAFVEDMNENWNERRKGSKAQQQEKLREGGNGALYSVENMKKDYRLKKQRIHASLWMKEIEKMEEAKLGDSTVGGGDDIERLLDSCSDIFYSGNNDLNNAKVPSSSELKNAPDGWETTAKTPDGNIWEMSQREEDILLQEFDRRIAYCKFQIASFIKTHIFSRRRPIDGWKYMIEVVGPNAKKGKGSVSRVPALSDASTQPFKEDKTSVEKTYLEGR